MLTAADRTYIDANYVTLQELCADRPEKPAEIAALIQKRRLPGPSYVLGDGTAMFPADYFRLVDEAGGAEALESHFAERHRQASTARGAAAGALQRGRGGEPHRTPGLCLPGVAPGT